MLPKSISQLIDLEIQRTNKMRQQHEVQPFPLQELRANPVGILTWKEALEFHRSGQISALAMSQMFRHIQVPISEGNDAA